MLAGKIAYFRPTGFDPRSISGLVAWFDAGDASTFTLSGTSVSQWRDKSGNGHSVSQSTGNNQPQRTGSVRGRPTVDFDGANDVLFSDATALSTFFNGDRSTTIFVVGEMHDSAENAINNLGTWVSLGSSSSGTPFAYLRSNGLSGVGQGQIRNDASSSSGSINSYGPAGANTSGATRDSFICSFTVPSQSATTWRTHTVMSAEGGGNGRSSSPVNGFVATSPAARPAGSLTSNRFTIGALGRNTFADYYPARISEVIVYSSALGTADRTAIVQWLGARYSLSTPVL